MTWFERVWKAIRGGADGPPAARDPGAAVDVTPPPAIVLASGALKLRVGVVSAVGNYRGHNEDNYYVPGRRSVVAGGGSTGGASTTGGGPGDTSGEMPASVLDPTNLFIVADGMGGQQAGEEASRMAVEIIPRAVARRLSGEGHDPDAVRAAVRDAVAEANREILGASGAVTEHANMGTTVVLALFHNDRAFVAGVGDSRAYRLRDGRLDQLTKDHSLADALVDAGTITKDELPNHKFKNILYLYLGSKDARGGPEDVRALDVRADDRFLLATDGLTGSVDDGEIARLLAEWDDPQRAAKALKDLALANDSRDNVTCLVVHVIPASPA